MYELNELLEAEKEKHLKQFSLIVEGALRIHGLTVEMLAELLNVSTRSVCDWRGGRKLPRTLRRIAIINGLAQELFQVNEKGELEYGEDEEELEGWIEREEERYRSDFSASVEIALERANLSRTEFSERSNVSIRTVEGWLSGTYPRDMKNLVLIHLLAQGRLEEDGWGVNEDIMACEVDLAPFTDSFSLNVSRATYRNLKAKRVVEDTGLEDFLKDVGKIATVVGAFGPVVVPMIENLFSKKDNPT